MSETHDQCPGCTHQTFVHGLSGGCSARDCDCTRDNTGRERSAVKLGLDPSFGQQVPDTTSATGDN